MAAAATFKVTPFCNACISFSRHSVYASNIFLRTFCVAVNLPVTAALKVAPFITLKAFYIFRRIAENDAYFMRKAFSARNFCGNLV